MSEEVVVIKSAPDGAIRTWADVLEEINKAPPAGVVTTMKRKTKSG